MDVVGNFTIDGDLTLEGQNANQLLDGSNADALHTHSGIGATASDVTTTATGLTVQDYLDDLGLYHTIASHNDTTATGAELNTLTDGSNADALHSHSGVGGVTASDVSTTTTGSTVQDFLDWLDQDVTTTANVTFNAVTTPALASNGGFLIVNTAQADSDFVIRGTGDIDLFYVDSGNDRVGIGTNAPGTKLDVDGAVTVNTYIDIPEQTAPGNPASNEGRIYVADDGGTTTLYFKDSAGTATDLLAGGGSAGALDTQSISYAAAISPDATNGTAITVGQLTGNISINLIANDVSGYFGYFKFTCDGTNRTITWNSANYLITGGVDVWTMPASTTMIVYWISDGTNIILTPIWSVS